VREVHRLHERLRHGRTVEPARAVLAHAHDREGEGRIEQRDGQRELVHDRPASGPEVLDGGAQVVMNQTVRLGIVEGERHPAAAAEADVGHPGPEAVGVRQQPGQARAQTQAQTLLRRAQLLAGGEHGEQEPAREHPAHRRGPAGGGRPIRSGSVATGQLDIFGEALGIELEDAMPREVVEERRHPAHVRAQVGNAAGVGTVEHGAQHFAQHCRRLRGDRPARRHFDRSAGLRERARPFVVEAAQRLELRAHRLAGAGHDGRAREAGAEHGLALDGMETEREQPAGQRLPLAAEPLVDAAPVVVGKEPAGPVRALADAEVAGVPGDRLERVARGLGRPFRLREPLARPRLPIRVDLGRGDGDVPSAAAAAAALLAGEALLGVVAEGDHGDGSVYARARRARSAAEV